MFDLVLTLSVGVLLWQRVWLRIIGLVKKIDIKNTNLIWANQKSYGCHATLVGSDKLLSFLKGHFFTKDFASSYLFFVLCVCLSVTLFILFLPPHPKVQCPNFYIWNPWGKEVVSDLHFFSKMMSNCCAEKKIVMPQLRHYNIFFFFYRFLSFVHSV